MSETEAASSLYFVDTNIWLYALIAGQDAAKSARARQLLQKDATRLVVSSQVINEVCVNLLKKAHVPESTVAQLIRSFYRKYPVVLLDEAVQTTASELRAQFSFSFWDSLIVAAALIGGATILYSEDMQTGLAIHDQLTIVNPFAIPANSAS
jgi:predicted nucleic acid-binding protein